MKDNLIYNELPIRCEAWDGPLGPFLTPEDFIREMDEFADKIGPAGASKLADYLKNHPNAQIDEALSLWEFANRYQLRYPKFTQELLIRLDPSGPPVIVYLLGNSKDRSVVEKIIKTIDINKADTPLLISFLGAIGTLGGEYALKLLYSLNDSDFSEEVQEEIAIAKHNAQLNQ